MPILQTPRHAQRLVEGLEKGSPSRREVLEAAGRHHFFPLQGGARHWSRSRATLPVSRYHRCGTHTPAGVFSMPLMSSCLAWRRSRPASSTAPATAWRAAGTALARWAMPTRCTSAASCWPGFPPVLLHSPRSVAICPRACRSSTASAPWRFNRFVRDRVVRIACGVVATVRMQDGAHRPLQAWAQRRPPRG